MTFGEFMLEILQTFTLMLLFLTALVVVVTVIENSAAWRHYWRKKIKRVLWRWFK